jgi:hypothetical protein
VARRGLAQPSKQGRKHSEEAAACRFVEQSEVRLTRAKDAADSENDTRAGDQILGFLRHKNPANDRSVEPSFGVAHVFYPEAQPDRCSATLLLEVDPVPPGCEPVDPRL